MCQTVDDRLWASWVGAVDIGEVTSIDRNSDGTLGFGIVDSENTPWSLSLRPRRRYVLGIDIVDFSSRSLEGQLYLTGILFQRLDAIVRGLRQIQWLSPGQPLSIAPTGDGALLIFDHPSEAFAVMLGLHMFYQDVSRGRWGHVSESIERAQPRRILPFEVRYALAAGELVQIRDVNQQVNFVGEALVRASRILAASKGAHCLVDDRVMVEFSQTGGINARNGAPHDWNQEFHVSRLLERRVKRTELAFHNVFGFYSSRELLLARMRLENPEATEAIGDRYELGSHDVSALT